MVIEPLPQDAITVFPDFTEIADISDKKRQFLDYMEGFVAAESQSIYGTRTDLLLSKDIVDKGEELSDRDAAKIVNLSETYRIDAENKAIEDIINDIVAERFWDGIYRAKSGVGIWNDMDLKIDESLYEENFLVG